MSNIIATYAREILDSRGYPTVEVDISLADGCFGRASVPSGASTGSMEAFELRDHDPLRFYGKGVLAATHAVNEIIADAILGKSVFQQRQIDQLLIDLDGTQNKSALGANAILAVSLAVAKAAASSKKLPLFQYLGGNNTYTLPVPMMNIINGGMHADNLIDIQEFMIMPIGLGSFRESLRAGTEIFHSLRLMLKSAGHNTNVGDEGGYAPELSSSRQAMDFIIQAIIDAGYKPGSDIYLALDCAASSFYYDGYYHLTGENKKLQSDEIITYYQDLLNQYPIYSIEDPLSESDLVGWQKITQTLGQRVQLVGDDLFVTNKTILKQGIDSGAANSILIKPNQIGTLTEVIETVELAQISGYTTVISHRSGETEDTFISHLAVALNSGQIKAGSLSRTERLCKYNELLRIEEQLSTNASYAGKFLK